MVQTIKLLDNGSFSPNRVFQLGNKYESVGDQLVFEIPEKYREDYKHSYYLTLKLQTKSKVQKVETILLPVPVVSGKLVFTIGSKVTKNSGTYQMIFMATEVIDAKTPNDIDPEDVLYVSNVMEGIVNDNFLTNPINSDELDPNLTRIYDDLMRLYGLVEKKLDRDEFVGPYYYPTVTDGVISWERFKSTAENPPLPASKDIRGPRGWTGNYYAPTVASSILKWDCYKYDNAEGKYVIDPDAQPIAEYDFTNDIETAVKSECDEKLPSMVNDAVDARIKFEYDYTTQTLYIYDVKAIGE